MRRSAIIFPAAMVALTLLTFARYLHINDFRQRSQVFTVDVRGDDAEVERIKNLLEDMTFQEVDDSTTHDRRRLTLRCPPDKLPFLLLKAGLEDD